MGLSSGKPSWLYCLTALLLCAYSPMSFARWAKSEDATSKTRLYRVKIDVMPRSSIIESEVITEVLKDGGREVGTWRYSYNPETTRIQIIDAATVNKGKRIKVSASAIIDKPIQHSTQGFDQLNELMVSFPQVQVGSQTILKVRVERVKYPLRVFTWRLGLLGWGLIEKAQIDVTSTIPLFSEFNDPRSQLEISSQTKNGKYHFSLRNKTPLHENIVDEKKPILRAPNATWWNLSEVATYPELPNRVLGDYEKIISAPLPSLHQQVLKAANGVSVVEITNQLTSSLHERVRYMGDWRGVRGTHVPRALVEIARLASGDCKDYAASMVALLRAKKIKASVAIVWSDESGAPELGNVPYDGLFNHAIVYIEHEGKTYWVDPTDPRSFAQGIPPHLLDRSAVVLDPQGARVVRIPATSPAEFKTDDVLFYDVKSLDQMKVKAELVSIDGGSYGWTLLSQYASRETIEREIARNFFAEPEIESYKFDPIDFSARIVAPETRVNGELVVRPQLVRTSEGQGLYLKSMEVVDSLMDLVIPNRVSDFYWTTPMSLKKIVEIKGQPVRGRELKGCKIQSQWFNYERLYQANSSRFVVQEEMKVKKSHITHEDMTLLDFRTAYESLRHCTQRTVLIF